MPWAKSSDAGSAAPNQHPGRATHSAQWPQSRTGSLSGKLAQYARCRNEHFNRAGPAS
jgi:hypothetical protein